MRTYGGRPAALRPVMMMAPGELADEVSRLAAAAGCELHRVSDVRSDPSSVREQWSCAPLLLLDLAAARDCASTGLPRRDGVVIVCFDADPQAWRCAVAVGAQHGTVALADDLLRHAGLVRRHDVRVSPHRSSFAGFRFSSEVIIVAVRWYLRYGLSYRDVEELLAERGIAVDHVSVYRWVQRFTPLLINAARPCRHAPGDHWFVDETYVKVAGRWVYLYRAIDQYGQVIDVLVSEKRDLAATRRFLTRALDHGPRPTEVSTDRAPAYPRILDELLPTACHLTEQYSNNAVEADHGRLKARLRPMRGLNTLRSAHVISTGHAFVQNLRRGHYELATHIDSRYRIPAAFAELAHAI
jgi:transposase-like protein